MAIRKINPTSPGQRGMTKSDYQEITTSTPEKSLLKPLRKKAGRNNTGRNTNRFCCGCKAGQGVRIYYGFGNAQNVRNRDYKSFATR